MIVDILLAALLAILFFWQLAFPVSAWVVVRFLYPRRIARLTGTPGFRVNLVVPCKGSSVYLEENLRAFAAQDYPDCVVTFVTNTAEDTANPVIAAVARGNPRVRHLVCGMSDSCAPKVYAQIAAVDADPASIAYVFGDSDMRPQADWLKEMVHPFIDPSVSVTTSHRWVKPDARGFAPSLYAILSGYYCMYLASPILPLVWGGAFGITRAAYAEMGIRELWSTTASDDLALSNRMAERHVRPFFVPRGVTTSHETHRSMASLMKWYNRQSLAGKLHEFGAWLGGLALETIVSLSLAGSVVLLAVQAATVTIDFHALAAALAVGSVVAGSLITKLTYPRRGDIPLWRWALLPLAGHFVIAASFWCSAFMHTMTWGSFTFTVGRDGKVARIEPEA